ncbi:prevent-host-death protein [Leptospira yasudae]|uniref:Prevent-host-death protein n=1 Tax=Leptospira yasudae TaxID=2202201 RepID=A0ABX9M742_9LEPT|nr:prevent-host-death protein [Leptospira yasudae]RHX81533.1 prevent-host-death protein [Leptospira yasudae]RHX95927.1 prevent-host-death protein [Leptospira yasudae]TGK29739.1 prevent-host-death protein [Leptospira yasudae]TGM07636.1 prevent-host-death protein [Leptospira yasudae]TGN01409.1 prevent-host-death protein [Leptospira yasudae]
MKSFPIGELKSNFSKVLESVKNGENVGILYGKGKKPIAMIIPITTEKSEKRKIGLLDRKAKITFKEEFKISEEEFLELS